MPNVFLTAGTWTILLAQTWLIWIVWHTKDTVHISGKTQVLYLLCFILRYLNLFTTFISFYNVALKIAYLVQSVVLVIGIYWNMKKGKTNTDHFRVYLLLIPTALLSLVINHEFSVQEILWTLSIYLEAVAMWPQMFMVRRTGGSKFTNMIYLPLMFTYRALFIINWMYRFYHEGYYDEIAIGAGVVQTLGYIFFFLLQCIKPVTAIHFSYQEVKDDEV